MNIINTAAYVFLEKKVKLYSALRKNAYSYILKILPPINEIFSDKKKSIFFTFLLITQIVGTG